MRVGFLTREALRFLWRYRAFVLAPLLGLLVLLTLLALYLGPETIVTLIYAGS